MKAGILMICFLLLSSFSFAQEKKSNKKRDYKAEGYVLGKVVNKSGLDGCGFMLQLVDSSFLQLNNSFPEKLKKAGKYVWVRYEVPKKPVMSICMKGKIVNILDAQKGKKPKKTK